MISRIEEFEVYVLNRVVVYNISWLKFEHQLK